MTTCTSLRPVHPLRVTGDAYVRRGLFARWVRDTYRLQISSAALVGRMVEVGWHAVRLQAWPPGVTYSERAGTSPSA